MNVFIYILCSCVGCFISTYLFRLLDAIRLKKQLFQKNYFKDTDFDFFNDDNNDKSITDIKIEDIKEE